MRITNQMILNNSLTNISGNKVLKDKLNTQMSTQQKISRPSEDPVVAIRSLRLSSTLTEIEQYYEKNIPDAESWLDLTEDALSNMEDLLEDIYEKCSKGANGSLTSSDRTTVLTELTELTSQIYEEGNADSAGRTLFTGYKTDSTLTFQGDSPTASYNITEDFAGTDIETLTYVSNQTDVTYGTLAVPTDTPETNSVSRIRLAYDNLTELPAAATTMNINYVDALGVSQTISVAVASLEDIESSGGDVDDAYLNFTAGTGGNFIPETGELILNSTSVAALQGITSGITFSYEKTGFSKGEIKPEHYFDCTDNVTSTNYVKENQAINYAVSFNQTLTVNTQASDVLDSSIGRDMNELMDAIASVTNAETKVTNIQSMMKDSNYSDATSQATLSSMLTAAQKEVDMLTDKMETMFSSSLTKVQGYMDSVNLAISNTGTTMSRLAVTKERLSSQQTTFEDLQSQNDQVEISDVILEYNAAETAYDASLVAASKAVQTTLLDYLS